MGRIRKLCMIKLALTEIYNYKLFDFEYSSEISMDGRILWIVHDTTFGPIPHNTIAIYKNE